MRRYQNCTGSSAIEFAVVAPAFMLFLFATLGIALDGLFQLALDDAARHAARQIQINGPAAATAADFVATLCGQFSYLATDCMTTLTYNIQASPASSGFASLTPVVLPASGQLGGGFFIGTPYGPNVNVLIQAAYPLPFTLPFVSTMITGTGTGSILATVTVRAESF